MSGFEFMPILQAMGTSAGATAGSMAVNKAGQAAFGGDAVPANQAPPPGGPGGMQAPPAMNILAAVQQQMRQEEAQQQQALMALLTSLTQGMQPPQRQVQVDIGNPTVGPGPR